MLGFHDLFHKEFGGFLASRESINGFDHLFVCGPLVPQILGFAVINVMLSGNPIQLIDTLIPTFQSFFKMCARPCELMTWQMKFNARLVQPLLNIQSPSNLSRLCGCYPASTVVLVGPLPPCHIPAAIPCVAFSLP